MGKSIAVKPLDVVERGELRTAEATIERGELTFIEVGNALLAIRDGRLYRETHRTFEAYCRERWHFDAARARQLIAATKIAESVEIPTLLSRESHARALSSIPPDKREAVLEWAEEKAAGTGKGVTAAAIRQAAADLEEEPDEDIPETPVDRMKQANSEIAEPGGGGKQKSDPRLFAGLESKLGACLRSIDSLHKVHPADKFHENALRHVKDAMQTVTDWQKATRK